MRTTWSPELTTPDPIDPAPSSEDVSLRPVEVQLRDGERFRGLLAFSSDEVLALEVEGHLLELRRREVVSERYLDQDPSWVGPSPTQGAKLRVERLPLGEGSLLEVVAEAFAERARLLFLPSRAPEAWAALPDEANPCGPFPLWDPTPELPLECVPHLVALSDAQGKADPWAGALLSQLQPLDFVLLESATAPLALAGFLAQLRWAFVEGRALGLRFYDPRVLGDLWEHLDSANLGLLFGGAWTRDERGQEDLRCVLCDGDLAALSRRCSECGAQFLGDEEAPLLCGAQARLSGEDLVVARPETGRGARRVLARPQMKGRKAFWLEPAVVAALGGAYRQRVEGQDCSEASRGAASAGGKT
tara:strand:+ start:1898 stop:2977 length:1080 start_codon:yes stop_codon:yes gene_type:complete